MEHVPFTTTIRAVLAVAMLAGFYLVGVGLLAGLTWLSVWLWLAFPGQVAHDVSYLLAATAVGLAVPTWRLLRARPEPPPEGVPVSEQQAPELWSQVRALAESVGTRPPDEIRLVFEANAGVWEDARLLGLRPGRRCLYLGVPLLQAFAVGQVRAVVAHELGHYSHHHTRLGALTYRGMQVIVHTILGVGPRSVGGLVFSGYAALYFVVSLAVMRRMELEADRAAVRAAGRAAAVLALRDTSRLRSVWEVFLPSYVGWNQTRGYTPTELLAWFAWLVEHRPTELDRVEREWAGRVPDTVPRWDSHPPIDERVAMIERETGRSAVLDARPGEVLVAGLDTMAAALRTTGFDRHMEGVAQEDAERDADRLYHAAARVAGTRRRGLGSVLDLLADGRGMELRRASAYAGGRPLLSGGDGRYGLTAQGEALLAGLLDRLPALTAISAPSVASYLRLVPQHWAAPYQCWGLENREAALRLITGSVGERDRAANAELKCCDGSANPYLVVAAVTAIATASFEEGRRLPPEVSADPALLPEGQQPRRLPRSVGEAVEALRADDVLPGLLGEPLLEAFCAVRHAEAELFADTTPDAIAEASRWRY